MAAILFRPQCIKTVHQLVLLLIYLPQYHRVTPTTRLSFGQDAFKCDKQVYMSPHETKSIKHKNFQQQSRSGLDVGSVRDPPTRPRSQPLKKWRSHTAPETIVHLSLL